MQRRQWLQKTLAASALLGVAMPFGRVFAHSKNRAKVVVIGGGFGGATAAKYLQMWSNYGVDVTLVEANPQFVSCPMSNLVLAGMRDIEQISSSYDNLQRLYKVKVVQDRVTRIDPERNTIHLDKGGSLAYDHLILSPGIDFMVDAVTGLENALEQGKVTHAWKAGPQTIALRKQLEAMPDGGVYAISIPRTPYRCPPGPYERASVVADYFKRNKPKSKIIILDANEKITSKGALFSKFWAENYSDIIEYRAQHTVSGVDSKTMTLEFEIAEPMRADVINIIPPMRAGNLAVETGLATANNRWCPVDFLTFASIVNPHIHVIGDSIQIAPGMPKSGHMANQHGKTVAAAVLALLADSQPNQLPLYNNTCYSYLDQNTAIHVDSVHRYDAKQKTMVKVPGSGGVSSSGTQLEGIHAWGWAQSIWADTVAKIPKAS